MVEDDGYIAKNRKPVPIWVMALVVCGSLASVVVLAALGSAMLGLVYGDFFEHVEKWEWSSRWGWAVYALACVGAFNLARGVGKWILDEYKNRH